MRSLLKAISLLMLLVAFVGAVGISYAIVGGYMVASGAVEPGQPMYLDELAPNSSEVAYQFFLGAGLIALSLLSRRAIRIKLSASAA